MSRVLICWVGDTDRQASRGVAAAGAGPIGRAVEERSFDNVILLNNYPVEDARRYREWLQSRTSAKVSVRQCGLPSPTYFPGIYQSAREACEFAKGEFGRKAKLTFHISPGTPPMAVVWILLSKTHFEAELIQSSKDHGVETVDFPFEISSEFIPALTRRTRADLERISSGLRPEEAPEFSDILYQSEEMGRLIEKACIAAVQPEAILIQGETGTGKELLARAIHKASQRRGDFVPMNCGAIPAPLAESLLFGHAKGAFTGADKAQSGCFEDAARGTLFLDEVGELPLDLQVKLLRVIQDKTVHRLHGKIPIPVDVRIVSATNRDLMSAVTSQRFREDLFYRLGVLVLTLPPLREREGDISLLVKKFMERRNEIATRTPGYLEKRLSPSAMNVLLRYSWPGNIRELEATLLRAFVWSKGSVIEEQDIVDAMIQGVGSSGDAVMGQPLGNGFDLRKVLRDVTQHYLTRSFKEADGSKMKMAELLGFPNYQTVSNWMRKYGVKA